MVKSGKPPAIGANRAMFHHISLPVRDVSRSVAFYRDILGLTQIDRPNFNFQGAWFALGPDQQLHLIKDEGSTFRDGKGLDGRDIYRDSVRWRKNCLPDRFGRIHLRR